MPFLLHRRRRGGRCTAKGDFRFGAFDGDEGSEFLDVGIVLVKRRENEGRGRE